MQPQSTNRTNEDTNPRAAKVLKRGSLTVALSSASATGYYGQNSVVIGEFSSDSIYNWRRDTKQC